MPNNTLFLRLEGPLQSWGERSRWSVRDTAAEPTKSGVIGLIACALGYRTDEQIRPLSQKTRFGVRIDAPGTLLTDYHTIGGGYDYPTLLTSQGKPKKTPKSEPHTELSYRDYLSAASFLVAVQIHAAVDASLITQMSDALQNPVWPVFLGRKACIPSRPVFDGTGDYENLETALNDHQTFTAYTLNPKHKTEPFQLRMVIESDEPRGMRRRDNLYSRQHRIFHPRYVDNTKQTQSFLLREDEDHVSLQSIA
jgi:CRISPR system Cascade subunit CasD